MIIEELKDNEIQCIAEIEKLSFSKPWSEESIKSSFNSESCKFYTAKTDKIVGYIGVSIAADEGYILNVAVHPDFRGQGIGRKLVTFLIEKYGESLRFITLEVRPSNIAAVKLYTSLGFNKVGERPSYYSNPVENAILLTKYLNSNLEI
ncbi:MAG: ribosomal protein S18-alanine N-acetyltransferase [Ruminococcus sp.]|nr:ribosomal protein S18-alanine N-acetyltransferase [Ruminococcus sp.]